MFATLRDGSWVTALRLVAYPIAAFAIFLGIATWTIGAHVVDNGGLKLVLGPDLVPIWAAAAIEVQGSGKSPYDESALTSQEDTVVGHLDGVFPFPYPPTCLLLVSPLGMLPFAWALCAWTLLGVVAYVLSIWRIIPGPRALLPIFAFPGALVAVYTGQNGLFLAACFGSGLLLLDRKPWLSGVFFGLAACKPQLAMLIPIALSAGRCWRAFAGAFLCFAALVSASMLIEGYSRWSEFFALLHSLGTAFASRPGEWAVKMQSVLALATNLSGSGSVGFVVQSLASLSVTIYLAWLWTNGRCPQSLKGAMLVVAALSATPYLYDYDLAMLSVPLALLAREGLRDGFLAWEKTILALAWAMPLFARALSLTTNIPPTPFIIAALFFLIHRRVVDKIGIHDRSLAYGRLS